VSIVLDIQALQSEAHATRGIGRYAGELAAALLDAGAPVHTFACNPEVAPAAADVIPEPVRDSGLMAWNTPERIRAASASGPLVYHIVSPFEATRRPHEVVAAHAFDAATIIAVTLHDAIPFQVPERYQVTLAQRRFFARRAALVRNADVVLTNSEHTAADAVRLLDVDPARVHVAGTGGSAFFTPTDRDDNESIAGSLPELRRPYVLSVSGFDARKDPETLIRAFARLPHALRASHQLVIVCDLPPEGRAEWGKLVADSGLTRPEVLFTGRVDDHVLRSLYRRAALFAFTSRAEGFGIPILEAARCGCPAVSSDATALPEVLAEPASTFPAGDVDALRMLLERGLTDDGFRATLLAAAASASARHTWAAVAGRTLEVYDTALRREGRRPARARSSRPRLALVGPFPPSKSGVAVYSARVVEALGDLADVDCFVEGTVPPAAPAQSAAVRRFPIGALDRTFGASSYDAVIYALGNSYYHRRTLALARRIPGVVWLHDASLAGLYLTSFGLFLPSDPPTDLALARTRMREAVERCAGGDAPVLGDDDWWRTEAYPAAGLSMTEEVTRAARAVLVTTEAARSIVRAASRPALPITVVPLAVPRLPATVAAEDGGPPWIVSPGWVDPIKQPDDLVRVLAALRARTPVRLAFVGEAQPSQRDALVSLAAELGCADALTITGFVEDDAYRMWLARAACVVLLRRQVHGEGSAALADAIGAGRPVITNVAMAAELPRGVVELVDPATGVDGLVTSIHRVLVDGTHRDALTHTGTAYATSWRIEHVAAKVLDAALSAPRPEYPMPLAPNGASS
jgi:glycosyltransferase involved in cell wall biosynthesis